MGSFEARLSRVHWGVFSPRCYTVLHWIDFIRFMGRSQQRCSLRDIRSAAPCLSRAILERPAGFQYSIIALSSKGRKGHEQTDRFVSCLGSCRDVSARVRRPRGSQGEVPEVWNRLHHPDHASGLPAAPFLNRPSNSFCIFFCPPRRGRFRVRRSQRRQESLRPQASESLRPPNRHKPRLWTP